MTSKILRLPLVIERTGMSRSSLYALIKAGKFPRSISLSARSVGWVEEQVAEWIESRIKQQTSPFYSSGVKNG